MLVPSIAVSRTPCEKKLYSSGLLRSHLTVSLGNLSFFFHWRKLHHLCVDLCLIFLAAQTCCSDHSFLLLRPEDFGAEGSMVSYCPNFLRRTQADDLFLFLQSFEHWKREIDDFGPQDRKSFYWANAFCTFSYVGLRLKPNPWPSPLLRVRDQINEHFTASGFPQLTGCLGNNYEEGIGSIVWHCDEVRAHGPQPLIVSLTLSPAGARDFKLKHKETGTEMTQTLDHGSLIVMYGPCQKFWLHSLPLDAGKLAPHRISLTFRSIVPGYEDAQQDNGSMRDCLA